MTNDIHLSVVIPAYNKETVIGTALTKIADFLSTQDYKWEIIVVDDASTDSTLEKIKQLTKYQQNIKLLVNERNMKKGFAVKRGILEAGGKYALFLDADSQPGSKHFLQR